MWAELILAPLGARCGTARGRALYGRRVARLLVVEDDLAIGRALLTGLSGNGHEVTWVQTGRDALAALGDDDFELALVDLGLPDLDGVDLCRRIRSDRPGCVVVILTARDEEIDVVLGLEAGADDYLTKPFRLAELMARVRAHLRRGAATAGTPVLRAGDLEVDTAARRVRLGGLEITLRAKEFDLLARLASEVGVAVSRTDLMADVWDENWFGSTKTLDVHLSALRRKLTEAARECGTPVPLIVTLRGRGYRLDASTTGPAAG
jgi:DNA-binding response OmpR family regulator